jgi:hypothetical protein
MARGKATPDVVRWIIIRLSTIMSAEEISMYTDVGVRTVNEILAYFKQTGSIKPSRRSERQIHRLLCNYDIEVCISLLSTGAI